MSKARTQRVIETLGMPQGTAMGRLRKMVLFRQLKKYGDNVCVRCGALIESVDELSIEHIKPWEGRSAELFWDLDNIAFSHLSCNCKANSGPAGRPNVNRITPPSGTAWCRTCKDNHPVVEFAKNRTNWNGLRRDCRKVEKQYKDFIRGKVLEDGEQGAQPVSNAGPTLVG